MQPKKKKNQVCGKNINYLIKNVRLSGCYPEKHKAVLLPSYSKINYTWNRNFNVNKKHENIRRKHDCIKKNLKEQQGPTV